MSFQLSMEDGKIKIKTDRAGERAVSDTIDRAEFEAAVTSLGYTLSMAADPEVTPAADPTLDPLVE